MKSNIAYSEERNNFTLIKNGYKENREYRKYMILQRCLGCTALLLTVAEFVASYKGWLDEGGLFLLSLPLGLYLVFKKELVL